MLESRKSYGWGGTTRANTKKWQVWYRTFDGGIGCIGYKLFDTKQEAEEFGEELKAEKRYIKETGVRRPLSGSNY